MREIAAMVVKDVRLLFRDRMGFFFTFVFPLAIAVFFGTIFSGSSNEPRGIRVAVVDEDRTDASRAFANRMAAGPELAADTMSRADAMEAVRLGRRTAFVAIPPGFGEARKRVLYGEGPQLELGLDPSRRAEAGMLQGVLTQYMSQRIQELFSEPRRMRELAREGRASVDSAWSMPPEQRAATQRFLGELDRFAGVQEGDSASPARAGGAGWQPVTFRTTEIARDRLGPRNAYEVSFPQGVIWAILSTAFGFALSLVNERTRGTLVRLRMAPFPRHHILIGKALGCLLTILAVTGTLLAIGALAFHVRPSSAALLAAALGASAMGFVGIMLAISVVSRSQRGVSGLGWAAMMVMSMTGGGMVPLFVMPPWMQALSVVSPVRWAITAIEGAIWRGFTPAQMVQPCVVLVAIGIAGFALGARVFRWTET